MQSVTVGNPMVTYVVTSMMTSMMTSTITSVMISMVTSVMTSMVTSMTSVVTPITSGIDDFLNNDGVVVVVIRVSVRKAANKGGVAEKVRRAVISIRIRIRKDIDIWQYIFCQLNKKNILMTYPSGVIDIIK